MKRTLIGLAAAALVLSAVWVEASIRVNGNQLLSTSGDWGSSVGKQATANATSSSTAPSRLIFALGQGVIADGRLPDSGTGGSDNVAYRIGIGLGFDIAAVVYNVFCPVTRTGDVNDDGEINSRDIVRLIDYIYRGGATLEPCLAAGDVDCSGEVSTGDCMYLVNHIFRNGPEPCDVCDLIPGTWSCP